MSTGKRLLFLKQNRLFSRHFLYYRLWLKASPGSTQWYSSNCDPRQSPKKTCVQTSASRRCQTQWMASITACKRSEYFCGLHFPTVCSVTHWLFCHVHRCALQAYGSQRCCLVSISRCPQTEKRALKTVCVAQALLNVMQMRSGVCIIGTESSLK